jgi:competence protein ComEC
MVLRAGNGKEIGYTGKIRQKILTIIDQYIPSARENGLSKALLIGYRENLDKEIVNAYTNTGVIHVIAISGLHLGLIYGILAFFMKPLQRKKKFLPFRAAFICIFLWIFSILCGASPSVLRSALMFTCLLAGEVLQKENYIENALASSAFILLCYDPIVLQDIGFQLSYAAVGSLIAFNKSINSIYSPDNMIISFAWNSVSTSIAAQVLTTPLVLFHFHQFPLLFILSNLVAVPLSGIILVLLILLCLLSPLAFIAGPIARMAEYLTFIMNIQIDRLNSISFALVRDLKADLTDTVVFYFCIILFSTWLKRKKPGILLGLLCMILLWITKNRLDCG